jgi:hypothetical protein
MANPTWTGLEPATKERFQRTMLQVSNGASGGTGLLQNFINRTVQMLTVRELGILSVLDRRQGSGYAEYINQRTALTSADGASWVADTATALSSGIGTYAQKEFVFRTLATRGYVTRKMQAIGKSYMDVLALELAAKAEDFANALDYGILYGQLGASTANELTGLVTLLQNANDAGATQTVDGPHIINNGIVGGYSTTNVSKSSYYALSLQALDAAIDAVKGSGNRSDLVILASYAGMRQLNGTLQAQQQFIGETEIAAGFRVRTYDGIPMIIDSNIYDTMHFQGGTGNGKSGHIKALTGHKGTQFYIVNKRFCYLSELTPTTVVPLAKDNSQFDKFDMYWDGAAVLANPYGMAVLSNVSSDGATHDS